MGNFASRHTGTDVAYPGGRWRFGSQPALSSGADSPLHEQYRHNAREEERSRQECSQTSQFAYHRKDHTEAALYSKKAKDHAAERDRWSAMAAMAYFALANPSYDITSSTSLSKCDLHGLTIAEALIKAKEHVRACKALHLDQTILITGKGLHSKNGRARLKPALEQFCREEKIGATIDPRNEGRIHLQLDTSTQKPWYLRWSNTGDDACTIM